MKTTANLSITMAMLVLAASAWAQTPDPDILGPGRRAAGAAAESLGAPGVEQRIEDRQQMRDLRRSDTNPNAANRAADRMLRDDDPERWRYLQHENRWWYYTPQNQWMYYDNGGWLNYGANVTVAPRYTTGYRGPVIDPGVRVDAYPYRTYPTYGPRYAYPRPGLFGRRWR